MLSKALLGFSVPDNQPGMHMTAHYNIQKLTQSMEEAQKGMLDMATELRELRGLPDAIQKQFEEQQAKSDGKDKEKPEPLITMVQWKELLETNKKASSLPPTPAKAASGLFTAACGKVKATKRPHQDRFCSSRRQPQQPQRTRPSLFRRLALRWWQLSKQT